MLQRLEGRLAAFGFLFTFAVGALVGFLGHRQLMSGVRDEALARVEDAVGVAERLLDEELNALDPLGPNARDADENRERELPEDLEDLVRQVRDRAIPARGYVVGEDGGLAIAAAALDADGRVRFVSRSLRGANWIPDAIRRRVFGDNPESRGNPTVTIFEMDRRIATNVRRADGSRAVGTRVSREVAEAVLGRGRDWNDRAYVVNRWVLTSYHPLRGPDGRVLGMIYVGLDEAPYLERGRRAAWVFLAVILSLTLVVSLVARQTGRRLAQPLGKLVRAANALAHGERHHIAAPRFASEEVTALTESFNEMADQVTARTQALRESRAATQQALDQYLEVLGFVAHQLKSPVAGALTALNLLEEGYGGALPQTRGHPLLALRRHLDYAQEIAVSFNILSRTESLGFQLDARRIEDLGRDLIEPVLRDLRPQAEAHGMRLELSGASVQAEVDPTLLRIAVDNLIGNAIKYGRQDSTVDIETRADGDAVVLSVRNEGLGVREESYPELFGKFSRVDEPGFRGIKGTGLGLYFVRRIAELHGGSASVRGEYGAWIEFSLRVPLTPPVG